MYVANETNIGNVCSSGQKHTLTVAIQSECFFQLVAITEPTKNSHGKMVQSAVTQVAL